MKLLFFLIILSSTTVALSQSVHFDWAKSITGNYGGNSYAIVVDSIGNSYLTGSFSDTIDVDPDIGTYNLISNGDLDVFILKLNTYGNLVWAFSIGGTLGDGGSDIAIDVDGNVIVTGVYRDSLVDFDPDSTSFIMETTDFGAGFILKLDENGHFILAKSIERANIDAISLANSGSIYLAGRFQNTIDLDPGIGIYNVSSTLPSFFVAKYTTNGDFVWGNSAGYYGNTVGVDLIVNAFEDVFTVSKQSSSCLIRKLDITGNEIWSKTLTATTHVTGSSITLDFEGNLLIAGNYKGTPDFDPGIGQFGNASYNVEDAFIEKLDIDGNFIWNKTIGYGGFDEYSAVITDNEGNVYLTGRYQSNIDFNPGPAIYNAFPSISNSGDFFIQKLNNAGNFQWVKTMGGNSSDKSNDIAIDLLGNLYITGTFQSTSDFDPSQSVFNQTAINNDSFVEKFSACVPNTSTETQVACNSFQWIDGLTYSSNTNTATFNYCSSTFDGCDSIVTLDLIINNLSNSISNNGPVLTADQNGAIYQWLNCNTNFSPIAGQTSQNFTALANGNYAVKITLNGCTDTSECILVDDYLNLSQNTTTIQSAIFPNPCSIEVTIYISSNSTNKYTVELTDLLGKRILQRSISGENYVTIPLYENSKGIYLLSVTDQETNSKQMQQLIIE
jgi:hypothetical protein